MTELWVNLRSGFGNLEPNERTALVALGIFMLMLLCYFTLTSAMSFYSNRLEERNRYVALVARMESTIDTARQNLGGTASTLSGQQILNQVSPFLQRLLKFLKLLMVLLFHQLLHEFLYLHQQLRLF